MIAETASTRTLDDVIAYCQADRRICPQPLEWKRLYHCLPQTRRVGNGWSPPLPLTLAAWANTTDEEKRARFHLHVRWAWERGRESELTTFVLSLEAAQWHFGDETRPMFDRKEAIEIVVRYVGTQYLRHLNEPDGDSLVTAGWPCPERPYIPNVQSVDQCPWVAMIPADHPHVGGNRYVAVSRFTGEIIADGYLGE